MTGHWCVRLMATFLLPVVWAGLVTVTKPTAEEASSIGMYVASSKTAAQVVKDLGLPLRETCYRVLVTHSSRLWGRYQFASGWPKCKHHDDATVGVLMKDQGVWRYHAIGTQWDRRSALIRRLERLGAPRTVVLDYEACWNDPRACR